MSKWRGYLVGAALLLGTGAGGAYWMHAEGINPFRAEPPYPALPKGVEIAGTDLTWIAAEIDASEYDGFWRVRADMYPKNYDLFADEMVYETRRVDLCSAALAALPALGVDADPARIHRVEVRVFYPRNGVFQSNDPAPEPITVRDGECQPPPWGVRYGGALRDWQMTRANVFKDGAQFSTTFEFVGDDPSVATAFPHTAICKALVNDPFLDDWQRRFARAPVDWQRIEQIVLSWTPAGADAPSGYNVAVFQYAGGSCALERVSDG